MAHEHRIRLWSSGAEVTEWFRIAQTINIMPQGQEKIDAIHQHMTHQADLFLMFPEPILPPFVPTISTADEREIENYNKECKREKADADSILSVFKSTLGPIITTELTSTWNDADITSIRKARATWDYIRQYRTMNADAVVTQLKLDIAQLPSAHSIQAAQHVYKQMASLQHQLITVGAIHAYAEDELVSLLKGKMVGTSFTNFKFILRSKEKITTVPTLRLDPLAFTAPIPDQRISWQELGQSIQMAVEEEISSQSSSTTSSMLISQGDEVATALASQMLPSYGRQQQRSSNQSRLPIRSMHANPTNLRQYSSDRQSTPAGGYRRPEQAYNAAPARFQPRGYPPTQAQFPPLPATSAQTTATS